MGRIKNKNTQPEMIVRRLIHAMGYRYRLHVKELPGKPDLVFPRREAVIFVHGCFWHRHEDCKLARVPKTRLDFWVPKLEGNRLRDARIEHALRALGWRVMTVWECQLARPNALQNRVKRFLEK